MNARNDMFIKFSTVALFIGLLGLAYAAVTFFAGMDWSVLLGVPR